MPGGGQPALPVVWVDFGGVLTPPVAVLVGTFCQRAGLTAEMLVGAATEVARRYGVQDPLLPLEAGLVSEPAWSAEVAGIVAERFGHHCDLSDFARRWLEPHQPDQRWCAYLESLRRRGARVGLLSNMMPSFEPHWRAVAPPGDLFDHVILSFEVGLRKPEPAIYALAARRAGVPEAQCLLIDDAEVNCAAARDRGWSAILAGDTETTVAATEALLRERLPAG